ncbi:hypothetical protein BN2497_1305 [Janthinobacterium sp. CG23_2]|nr:hypothetical protein [Massilia sp. H27-R4]CUI03264.1 hypothetical protein BN2497_1305 [Janthinobacterium sp. CG23_2]CUU27050.1 hypothetical protein BN3177_1305 [Janthinobacterium sp. CG23_2]
MRGAYSLLLELCAEHAYFPAGASGNFRFVPTAQCAALLDRFGILTRPSAHGLALVGQDTARADLQGEHDHAAELEFGVLSTDPHFSLFTGLDAPAPDACLFFHSALAQAEGAGRWRLHPEELAGPAAWRRPRVPDKAAALAAQGAAPRPAFFMVLALADVAGALAQAAAPVWLVRFGARASVWKYHFLSDLDAPNPVIVDLDDKLRFSARGRTPLPGNRSALTFASEQAIAMRKTPEQRLQLRDQGELGQRILIKRLPNASVAAIGREIAEGSAVPVLVSEIYIP